MLASALLAVSLAVLSFASPATEKRQALAQVITQCTKPNNVALTFVCSIYHTCDCLFDWFSRQPGRRTLGILVRLPPRGRRRSLITRKFRYDVSKALVAAGAKGTFFFST